jgi:hypothetical protein
MNPQADVAALLAEEYRNVFGQSMVAHARDFQAIAKLIARESLDTIVERWALGLRQDFPTVRTPFDLELHWNAIIQQKAAKPDPNGGMVGLGVDRTWDGKLHFDAETRALWEARVGKQPTDRELAVAILKLEEAAEARDNEAFA